MKYRTWNIIFILVILTVYSFSKNFKEVDGKIIAQNANKYIGNKYVYGGNSFTKGIDCSAFVKKLYMQYGYMLPRTAKQQAVNTALCPTYTNLSELKKGDTLYFMKRKGKSRGKIHHVGVLTGFTKNGKIIMTHAKGKNYGIVREVISKRYENEFMGAKRFYECTSPLGNRYTNKEIGSVILQESKYYNVSAIKLFDLIEEKSNLNPLLITIHTANIKGLMELKKNGVEITQIDREWVRIYPENIDNAKMLIKIFYAQRYALYIGLLQIHSDLLSLNETVKLIYPKYNISKYFQ